MFFFGEFGQTEEPRTSGLVGVEATFTDLLLGLYLPKAETQTKTNVETRSAPRPPKR